MFYELVGEQSRLLLVNVLMSVPMFTDKDGLNVNTQKGGFGSILSQAADHGGPAPRHKLLSESSLLGGAFSSFRMLHKLPHLQCV